MKPLLFHVVTSLAAFLGLAGGDQIANGLGGVGGRHGEARERAEVAANANWRTWPTATQPPSLENMTIEGDAHKLVELRLQESTPPEGFESAGFQWMIFDTRVSWRQYENGKVLVATAPPGTYEARCEFKYADWENRKLTSEWRVYTIKIRGPPPETKPEPEKPKPEPEPEQPPPPGVQVTAIIYDQLAKPTHGEAAAGILRKTGEGGIIRFLPPGEKPSWLVPAFTKAKEIGLPALVIMRGDTITESMPLPATTSAIVEAATK